MPLINNKNKKFQVLNKSETSAEILIYTEIGKDFWGDGWSLSAQAFSDAIKALPSTIKELHLRVNSPGGDVFEGMTIYNRIREYAKKGVKVVAHVDGLAASIASIIIMAADEVEIGDGAMIMIHKPWSMAIGNDLEMDKMSNLLGKIEAQMTDIYRKKVGGNMSSLEIGNALAEETWYTAKEAVDKGFADKVVEASNSLQIAASVMDGCKWLKNKPQMPNKNDIAKAKLLEFNNKAKSIVNNMKK